MSENASVALTSVDSHLEITDNELLKLNQVPFLYLKLLLPIPHLKVLLILQ